MIRISTSLTNLAAALLVLSAIPRAAGTTLAQLTLAQLARSADVIVRAQCISSESKWDDGAIWTFNRFRVSEVVKGTASSEIVVRLPGGRVGHIVATIEAVPRFSNREEGFLFLERTRTGDYSISAWSEGTFRIRAGSNANSETVTQDSSSFPVFDIAAKRFRNEGIRQIPVAVFRQALRDALSNTPDRGDQK